MNIYKMKTTKSNSKEINRIVEPSKFAIKFANTVFMLGILFSFLVAVYTVKKIYNQPENLTLLYFSFFLFAVFTAVLFGLGLRMLRDELKINMSVMFITVVISVYGFEIFNVIVSNINAYPNYIPSLRRESNGFNTSKGRIYPLGGISNITTILGNESGYYPIIKTDEYGFNNP